MRQFAHEQPRVQGHYCGFEPAAESGRLRIHQPQKHFPARVRVRAQWPAGCLTILHRDGPTGLPLEAGIRLHKAAPHVRYAIWYRKGEVAPIYTVRPECFTWKTQTHAPNRTEELV